jgi:hypothetical protein
MDSDKMARVSRIISTINTATHACDGWADVLNSLMQEFRIPGAAYFVRNRMTGSVEWACFAGLSAEFKSDYVRHYAALDPYIPLLNETWRKLSECLPEALLRKSEWYNDFVLKCGVRDILATRLVETSSHSVILGLHQQIGRTFADDTVSILSDLSEPLRRAASCHMERLSPSTGRALEGVRAERRRIVGATYYFHFRNGSEYRDETGSVFATRGDAIAHAAVLAGELVQEENWNGFSIHVANEQGEEIAQVPVRE